MRLFFLLLSLSTFVSLSAQSINSPEGRWKTLDDETGETKSIVEITKTGDSYTGRIVEILTDNKDALCDKCDGDQKGQPILGMTIISDLEPKKDYWDKGRILDPQTGNDYKLSAWYEDGDANVLYIRGKHWTGLFRTQKWTRE